MKEQTIKRSIRWKLLTTMIGLIVVLVAILTVIQISSQKEVFEKELGNRIALMKEKLIDRGKTLSDNLSNQVQNGIASFNLSNVTEILKKSVNDDRELHYAILMDTLGTAYTHTLKPELEQEILSGKEDIFAADQEKLTINEYEKDGHELIEFIVPIQVSTEPWGVLRLGFLLDLLNKEIVKFRREIARQTREMITRSLITSIIFIMLGAVIVLIISNKLSRPLVNLTKLANELARGNFAAGANIEAQSEDEIGLLATAFAGMSKDLKNSYENLEQIVEKRTKELAEARDLAVSATNSKSEFLSMMSHEIRTPMNAIIGMTHLVLRTELTVKQQDYLSKVESSAHSLLGIINDILDFSKIEAGKLDIETVDFNLEDVLNNLSNMMSIKAEEKGLEMHFAVSSNVPLSLVGDPLRLGQILLNLTNNAIKFTEKGEIIVKIESALESIQPDQIMLRFSVKDTGIGLTREQISRLFQSFSQADSSTTRKYEGTGLGLTISKRLVELMGGEIRVESEPGEGSIFIFTAKFYVQKKTKESSFLPPDDIKGMWVLVVDDSEISRKILQSYLESFSFNVTTAASGKEAIQLLENTSEDKPYKIVFMDWKMPEMDGIETSKRIKKNARISVAPIIIMVTAYGREELMQEAEYAGLDGFLIKPVNKSTLFDTIVSVFGITVAKKTFIAGQWASKNKTFDQSFKKFKGAKLLLVEDNAINRQVATEFLEGEGFIITTANNGKEAVQKVGENDFDAVLMDLQMPEMDGYTATRKIRNMKSEIRNIPIIALTAHAMIGEKEKCIQAGMNDYQTKPIELEKIFETLAQWIKPKKKEAGKIAELGMRNGDLKTKEAFAQSKIQDPKSEISKQKILIVDDVPINIKTLGEALRVNYEIIVATSGEKALTIAASENPPDMILLDIEMPEMDGYEVCKRLKDDANTKDIPVIFITGKAEVEDETKGLELGAVDYIARPFSIPIVNARVKNHLSLKKKSDMLENLACLDGLTNIPNRRRFDECIQQEWGRARRARSLLSLILIDVDYFKKYNDNYGHAAGDECLIKVAQMLENSLSRSIDFVARYGGEEFVAVLPETDIEPAVALAEKIRTNVENMNIPHFHSKVSDRITLSLGVATIVPTDSSSSGDLIKAADRVLYKAKDQGRNQVKSISIK